MFNHQEETDLLLEQEEIDVSEVNIDTPQERKKRTSGVPVDYDPTPDHKTLPKGRERPPMNCWVGPHVATPVELGELHYLWSMPVEGMEEAKRKHRFLASKVVSVCGEYWIKDKRSNLWIERKKSHEVVSVLMHDWGRGNTKYNIRKETIADFLSGREFIALDGCLYVPNAGDFVEFNGRRYLNTYHQQPMAFTVGAHQTPEFAQLMELIVRNLMGKDDGAIDNWIAQVRATERSDIKWLFHWLASQYQRQGKMLPTALWIVGSAQGVGKGIFASGIKQLLGSSNVKVVSSEEFQGGWTDFVLGASFIVLDEVDFGSRTQAYDKIKRLIGNELTAARKRNHGDIIVPSVCNFMFTTNRTNPVAMDRGDRRNTVFGTKNSQDARDRAQTFYNLTADETLRAWEGMADFLASIQIDDGLIDHAFNTDMKDRMIEHNLNPVEAWFLSDAVQKMWPINHFAPTEWLYPYYRQWMRETDGFVGQINKKYFGQMMSELNDMGMMSEPCRKTLKGDKKHRGYVRFDPDHPCSHLKIIDIPFAPNFQKSAALINMRSNIEKK